MASAPPVSVFMPAYNVERYVADAVRSILSQTFADYELIIIDDGSTDRTPEILRDFARQDARIRLVTRGNQGVSRTANEGLAMARGEFLARMDSDDLSMPDRLERQIAYLRENPRCLCLGSRVLLIDAAGMPLYVMPDVEIGHDNIDAALMAGGWPIVQPACVFRTDAMRAIGGYRADLSLHEDLDLYVRLAERGLLENLPEVLLQYRRHVHSITFREVEGSRRIVADILRDARQRRGLPEPTRAPPFAKGDGVTEMTTLARCRHWAWMSLKARHIASARKYAWAGFRRAPLSKMSWRLMYCALRGR